MFALIAAKDIIININSSNNNNNTYQHLAPLELIPSLFPCLIPTYNGRVLTGGTITQEMMEYCLCGGGTMGERWEREGGGKGGASQT